MGRIKDHKKNNPNQMTDWLDIEWLDEEELDEQDPEYHLDTEDFEEDDWDTGDGWEDPEEEKAVKTREPKQTSQRKTERRPEDKRKSQGRKQTGSSKSRAAGKRADSGKKKRPPQKNTGDEKKTKEKNRSSAVKPVKTATKVAGTAGRTAGKAAGKIVSIILKCGSFAAMVVIVLKMFQDFWAQRNVLGELWRVAADRNYAEALYLGIASVLLLYGIISALWILTGRKAADGGRIQSYDTGRGLTSFIVIAILAAVSGMVQPIVPESPQMLAGASLALQVIDGMKTILLGCCAAGIVLCVIRKFIRR